MFVMSSKKFNIKKTSSTAFSSLSSNHSASSTSFSTAQSSYAINSALNTSKSLQTLQNLLTNSITSQKKNKKSPELRNDNICSSQRRISCERSKNHLLKSKCSSVIIRKASASTAASRICSSVSSRCSQGYWCKILKNVRFVRQVMVLTVLLFLVSNAIKNVSASEFPERECCDPIYPVITSTAPPPPSAVTVPVGKTGLNVRTSIAILNCLLARQLCFEDASCSAILEIIPRVCGSELVACSTVTVTKCQAALRTLQAFPFFKPTCLCREPNVDPECNSFRDFLFDHPCVFVLKKEKDPYPVEALPTCNYALNVCHSEKSCASLFDTFKAACRARDGDCRMDDREQCRDAWTGLRMSPLFGCICPNNHMKKRCDRIFAMVNHNPCVESRLSRGEPDLFLSRMLRLRHAPRRLPPAPPSDRHPDRFNLHPSKLPESSSSSADNAKKPSKTISLEYKSNVTRYVASDGSILLVTDNGTQVITDTGGGDLIRAIIKAMGHRSRAHSSAARRNHDVPQRTRNQSVSAVSPDGKKIAPNKTSSNAVDWVAGGDVIQELEIDDNYVSPHVMEEGHRRLFGRPGTRKGGTHGKAGHGHSDGTKRIGSGGGNSDGGSDGHETRVTLRSTCHLALDRCIRDKSCTTALTPVLQACDASRCDREGCMEALRNFYRTPNVQWNLEIAFCLCKKTDNKEDPCMNAQEKLHPVCAQREPGAPLPACHVLAQSCREQPDCRSRLEFYEQSCAVDSVTKKCAGAADACRGAVLDMLGTELRTACACKGTDYTQLYDCLGWQRLLWLNPCVVESQSDFHIKTYGSGSTPSMLDNVVKTVRISEPEVVSYRTTTPFILRVHPTTPSTTTVFIPVETLPTIYSNNIEISSNGMKNGRNIEVEIQGSKTAVSIYGAKPERESTTTEMIVVIEETTTTTTVPTTVETTTPSTTTSTTTQEPVKFCVVQRPELDDQFVQKGHTRRLYRDAELDCSELCHCDIQLSVSCHAVCVRHAPCRTALAFYSHAAPAYQAYRGRCYCYSGSFICMRPNPGEYSLPPGVYLLLGFSSQDEALLRPHTRLGLEDAVRVLQEYMLTLSDEATNCTLTLFNVTNENMIVTAGIPASLKDKNTNALAILDTDKMECIGLLESIKSQINTQAYDISSHLLLSIFKIAEVDVVYPPPSSAYTNRPCPMAILLSFVLLVAYNKGSCKNSRRHKNSNSITKRKLSNENNVSCIRKNNEKTGCLENGSPFQDVGHKPNGRYILNIAATALSVSHALSLTLIVETCTNIFRLCCVVVVHVLKYFIHKLMLETIAHFFYFVNRILLIIIIKLYTVICPFEIFSKSTFPLMDKNTANLFLVPQSPAEQLIHGNIRFYYNYIKRIQNPFTFDRLIFKVYQIHINLAVNIKSMIKSEKKLLLFKLINGCNRLRKSFSKLRAGNADGNLVNFVVIAFINSARPKTDVFLLFFFKKFIGVHYEYNIHTRLPIFLKHITFFFVYDFCGYSHADIYNGANKKKENLAYISNVSQFKYDSENNKILYVSNPYQTYCFITDQKIFNDVKYASKMVDTPFSKMANPRRMFVR